VFTDARDTTVAMGKGLLDWDEWSKNPAEALGGVFVNVGTFFVPGGVVSGGVSAGLKGLATLTKVEAFANAAVRVDGFVVRVRSLIPDLLRNLKPGERPPIHITEPHVPRVEVPEGLHGGPHVDTPHVDTPHVDTPHTPGTPHGTETSGHTSTTDHTGTTDHNTNTDHTGGTGDHTTTTDHTGITGHSTDTTTHDTGNGGHNTGTPDRGTDGTTTHDGSGPYGEDRYTSGPQPPQGVQIHYDDPRVDAWVDQMHDRYPELSKDQIRGVYDYTTDSGYQAMNEFLRTGHINGEPLDVVAQRVQAAVDGLDQLPTHTGDVLYRGTNLPDEVFDSLKNGNDFSDPAFTSSSLSFDNAENFIDLKKPNQTVFVIEDSFSGVDIRPFSSAQGEAEILFKPSTKFDIVDVEDVDGVRYVRLKEGTE
jgi:hypothetical protein